MKIAMLGTGYVGLVSGVCFSGFGHDVVCVDNNPEKIVLLERREVPIYEPGLDAVMARNVEAGRLSFTTDLGRAPEGAEAVFIAVGTPTRRGDGHADLSYVMAAAEEIARTATGYIVIVTKSTVPVGTNRKLRQVVKKANPDLECDVASNPEFLREGAAIEDFMKPDRVVVGVQSERAGEVMEEIYRPLYLRDFTYVTDLVRGIRLLIDAVPGGPETAVEGDSLSPVAPFRVVNIGNSDKVRLLDFIAALKAELGQKAIRNYMPMQTGDVPATWADATLLQNLTSYTPQTPFREGVRRFVEWYRDYYVK